MEPSPETDSSLSGLDEIATNLGVTGIQGTLTEKIRDLAKEAKTLSNDWFVLELI
jgi:hypothetical protein